MPKPHAAQVIYFRASTRRYLAAAAVVFCHVEEVKLHYHFPNYYHFFLFHGVGTLAVSFFFVLSGFLITYLLLKEKGSRQDIDVPRFYVRRALRIWPVYYLVSLLGLFVLPHIPALAFPGDSAKALAQYPFNALLYIFFMPNVALWLNFWCPTPASFGRWGWRSSCTYFGPGCSSC